MDGGIWPGHQHGGHEGNTIEAGKGGLPAAGRDHIYIYTYIRGMYMVIMVTVYMVMLYRYMFYDCHIWKVCSFF